MTTSPNVDFEDLMIYRSKRSSEGLYVTVHDMPANGYTTQQHEEYSFVFRPRAERGTHRATVSQLGLVEHSMHRDHCLVLPPHTPIRAEWANAAGRVARFRFSPRFLETIADDIGLPRFILNGPGNVFFSIDQGIEALCRLLVEETENNHALGWLYFESLARALAVGLIRRLHDPDRTNRCRSIVPPGIGRAIRRLEADFAQELSLAKLAEEARLSRAHFALSFRQATGYTPHEYLMRARLSHARKLLTQPVQTLSINSIAVECGFTDQAHLGRLFRRFFDTTPGTFRRRTSSPLGP